MLTSPLLLALLLAPPDVEHDRFPAELTRFRPSGHGLLFTGRGEGHWDSTIRERGWILRENGRYHLWYTGYVGTDGVRLLGYAHSGDGIRWTRHPAPLVPDRWIEDMMVVRHQGTYYMVAEGRGDVAQLLTSTDGLQWTPRGSLAICHPDGKPISPGPYGTPTLWIENGWWYLFYERGDRGVWLARSREPRAWRLVQNEPILRPGPEPYDRELIALNQVVRHDGWYYAYYHGSGAERPRQWCTCIARSRDLLHWEKFAGNPIVRENKSSGIVVHDGQQYRLYTMHPAVDLHLPVR